MNSKNLNDKAAQSVAKVVADAQKEISLSKLRWRTAELTEKDFPVVAALLDLLATNPKVSEDAALLSAVSAIQHVFVRLWNDVEQVADAHEVIDVEI